MRLARRGKTSAETSHNRGKRPMITFLLVLHGIISVFLLGAVTHHALGVFWPRKPGQTDFVARARGLNPAGYVETIIILYVIEFILGALLYPTYRVLARPPLQDLM